MSAVVIETKYVELDCPNCGLVFAVHESYLDRRRNDARLFYCPNGHTMSYAKSEADKLREQLAATQGRLTRAEGTLTHVRDQHAAAERALRAQKGANTRLRKRVSNGVCPCCNRTFADLGRHMAGQHPDFVTTSDGEP